MSGLWRRLLALAHKEVLHMVRDPQVLYLALGMPLVMVLLFGYAVSFDVEDVHLAVIDRDQTPASRRFVRSLDASRAFDVTHNLLDEATAEAMFRSDAVKATLVIPDGFDRNLARGGQARLQLLMDGADATTARVAVAYAAQLGQRETIDRLRSPAGVELPIVPRVRTWFNPRSESAVFVVPGLVAVVLSVLAVLLAALTVAREWERGSMEQLFATPVERLSVVLGKVLPYVALGLVQFMMVLTAGAWLFDVPLRGSFAFVVVAVSLFLVCALGQGLLISMITRNQQVATQVGAVSGILPALLLSGFLFPIENMPWLLQQLSRIVAARYLIEILRGVLLKGAGPYELWAPLLSLVILAVALIALTTVNFRRRLD